MQKTNLYTTYLHSVSATSLPFPHDLFQKNLVRYLWLFHVVSCMPYIILEINKMIILYLYFVLFNGISRFRRSMQKYTVMSASFLSAQPSLGVHMGALLLRI